MTILAETECHRLIRESNWGALKDRLKTAEGRKDAKRTLKKEDIPKDAPDWKCKLPPTSQPDSIYHCPNVFQAPLSVIRAMSKANLQGWTTPCVIGTDKDGNPIEELPLFYSLRNGLISSSPDTLFFILETVENVERRHHLEQPTYFPLHEACMRKNDDAVELLVDAYPEAASMGADSTFGLPLIIGIKNQLKPKTLRRLLKAYPDAAELKISNDCFALHVASEMNSDSSIFETIMHCHLSACATQDNNGQLPLHRAINPRQNLTIDGTHQQHLVELLLEMCPTGAKAQDKDGNLPLHLLCARGLKSAMKLSILQKLLKIYPAGAMVKNNEGNFPITDLVKGWGYDFNAFQDDAFIQLTKVSPDSLLETHSYTGSTFHRLIEEGNVSMKVYKNVAIRCPRALFFEDEYSSTPLSVEFGRLSPNRFFVLDATVECLRHAFNVWSNTPVSDGMSQNLKIVYCGYLFSPFMDIPLPFLSQREGEDENEDEDEDEESVEVDFSSCGYLAPQVLSEQDNRGNNAFHVACSAPCPMKDKIGQYPSMIKALITWTPPEVVDGIVAHTNKRGETPLHLLLKNSNVCCEHFFGDIQILSKVNNSEVASMLDPIEGLYPFMSAAIFVEGRDAALSISATHHLLQMFINRHNLESFRQMNPGRN